MKNKTEIRQYTDQDKINLLASIVKELLDHNYDKEWAGFTSTELTDALTIAATTNERA